MKLVKKIAAIAACLAIATASMGIASSALTISRPSDFLSYSYNFGGSYSVLATAPTYGSLTSSNANYNGSSKYVFYATYEITPGGQTVTQSANTEWETSRTVICYVPSPPNAATSIRRYIARMYQTSSTGSPVVDSYSIDITK